MKKYTHLIRLIVITAALIGLGVMAFKYLHTKSNVITKVDGYIQSEKETQETKPIQAIHDVVIQGATPEGGTCTMNSQCTNGCKCLFLTAASQFGKCEHASGYETSKPK